MAHVVTGAETVTQRTAAASTVIRVAWVTSHPVQYHAPLFRELACRDDVDLTVYFASQHGAVAAGADSEFGRAFAWDVPLLVGYRHEFLCGDGVGPSIESWRLDAPSLPARLDAAEPNVVVVGGWNRVLYWRAQRWARSAGVPVVVRGDSTLRSHGTRLVRLAKWLVYSRLLARYDGFLVPGRRHREYLRYYGVSGDQLHDAPHSVDNDAFARAAETRRDESAALRREVGAGERDVVFLFVGKFVARKRPLDLVGAFRRLGDRGARLLFVGDGPLAPELRRAEAQTRGVHVLGFRNQSELPATYAAADALVLPSDGTETWGLVANEAMACGVPCFLSDACGATPDLVEDRVTGRRFPAGDVDALAALLAEAASDRASLQTMGRRARERVAAFSVMRTAQGVADAIAAVTRGGRPAR